MKRSEFEVRAGGELFTVLTCSARTALEYAERRTGRPAQLLDIRQPEPLPYIADVHGGRLSRRRDMLLSKALDMRRKGLSYEEVGRQLHVPRETVRDWIRKAKS